MEDIPPSWQPTRAQNPTQLASEHLALDLLMTFWMYLRKNSALLSMINGVIEPRSDILHAVADAANGLNEFPGGADLASQSDNLDIH